MKYNIICKCGKSFQAKDNTIKFCSQECRLKEQKRLMHNMFSKEIHNEKRQYYATNHYASQDYLGI